MLFKEGVKYLKEYKVSWENTNHCITLPLFVLFQLCFERPAWVIVMFEPGEARLVML